jgi:hypothetical protein
MKYINKFFIIASIIFSTSCGTRIHFSNLSEPIEFQDGKNPIQMGFEGIGCVAGGIAGVPVSIVLAPVSIVAGSAAGMGDYAPLAIVFPAVFLSGATGIATGAVSYPFFGWWDFHKPEPRITYNEDGTTESVYYYSVYRHGESTTKYPNGSIKSIINWKHGEANGDFQLFYENGSPSATGTFKENIATKVCYYDLNGNKISSYQDWIKIVGNSTFRPTPKTSEK